MDETHYEAPRAAVWRGRIDTPADPGSQRWHQNVAFWDLRRTQPTLSPKRHNFTILGFRCDAGVRRNQGRPGAAAGPGAIREALVNLPVPLARKPVQLWDAGDIVCQNDNLEAAQEALAEAVKTILQTGSFPIVLGGGHETAWGHYLGLKDTLKPKGFGIVNVDAHWDLRPFDNGGHSGSPFLQIAHDRQKQRSEFSYFCLGLQKSANTPALFKTAESLGAQWLLADDLHNGSPQKNQKKLAGFLKKQKQIYLTICLDAFAAAFAPGVSAPSALGLLPGQILPYLDQICATGKIVGFDIAEMAPQYDQNQITAKLAAQILFRVVSRLIK